jgi:hypothetical protein
VGYVVDYNPTTSKLVVVETSGTFTTGTLTIKNPDNVVIMATATLSATAAQLASIAVN